MLTGGAVSALTFGEYALGMGLLVLSAFSLTSHLWHRYDNGFLRVVGAFAITVALIALLGIAWDVKGDSTWSHIPRAWQRITGSSEDCKLFKASLGGILAKEYSGQTWGAFGAAIGLPNDKTLVSIDYMPTLRITNMQNVSASIKSYSLEVEDSSGHWSRLIKVRLPQHLAFLADDKSSLYFIHPDGRGTFTTLIPHSSLDDLLIDKAIEPGSSVSGWTYWAYPPGFTRVKMRQPLAARISIEDWGGHTALCEYYQKENIEVPLENNDSFTFGKELLDIKTFAFGKYSDYIKPSVN